MREFASYRSLCMRENKLKTDIRKLTADIIKDEKKRGGGIFCKIKAYQSSGNVP
jgi:hypothetical protein